MQTASAVRGGVSCPPEGRPRNAWVLLRGRPSRGRWGTPSRCCSNRRKSGDSRDRLGLSTRQMISPPSPKPGGEAPAAREGGLGGQAPRRWARVPARDRPGEVLIEEGDRKAGSCRRHPACVGGAWCDRATSLFRRTPSPPRAS